MGLGLNVSRDGGRTFTSLRGMHGDHHGLWIDPANPSILYNANDGGINFSSDAGATWKFAVSAGGAQFYNVTLDTSSPAWAYGSIQDIGSRRGKVESLDAAIRTRAASDKQEVASVRSDILQRERRTGVLIKNLRRTSRKRGFFCRSSMMSNDCTMGRPARTRASSSWLKRRKRSVEMTFPPRGRKSRTLIVPRLTSKTCRPWRTISSRA